MNKEDTNLKLKEYLFNIVALETVNVEITLSKNGHYIFKLTDINKTTFQLSHPQNVEYSFENYVSSCLEIKQNEMMQFLVESNLKLKDIAQIDELILNFKNIQMQELSFEYNRDNL